MKKSLFLLTLLVLLISAKDEYTLTYSLPFNNARYFTTDRLGRVYVVVGNQLLQFNQAGKPMMNFSDISLGELRSVDVTNPLKILLFYPDFQRIVILNNRLAPTSTINLQSLEILQPVAVSLSENGGYWVYDRLDDRLKKLDQNLQVISQSPNLTPQLGFTMQPRSMTEQGGFLYIHDAEHGLILFDQFGTYYQTLHFKNVSSFQVIDRELLFTRENKLYRYRTGSPEETEILLPVHDSLIGARIEQQQLYLLTTASLNFYSF